MTQETPQPTPEGNGTKNTPSGRRFTSDSPTMEEVLRLKKPNTRTCHILLDSSLAHEIGELEAEIERLEKRETHNKTPSLSGESNKKIDSLKEELEELEDRADEMTVPFTFQDIGRKRYDELIRENQPSDEEKKEYKEAGGDGVLAYSTETFPPKLIAECSVSPKISEDDAIKIFEEWSEGDLQVLFTTALLACKEPTSLPKSRADTVTTQDLQQSLTSALNEESPTPNS